MLFWKRNKSTPNKTHGLLIYGNVQDVIASFSAMQKEGMKVALVPPPADIAIGCDLAVQFSPEEEEVLRKLMGRLVIMPGNIHYSGAVLTPVENLARIEEIEPGYLMAISNNIKVTLDLATREIVNISGGGCPDIPYVAHCLVGCKLDKCPEPVEVGTTLCSYMVQLAVDRLRREVL